MRRSKLASGGSSLGYLFVLVPLLVSTPPLMADDEDDGQDEFSRKGADTCISCHDEEAILSIFRTPHGHPVDANAPFAHEQCESCHQAGAAHSVRRVRRGEGAPADRQFWRAGCDPGCRAERNLHGLPPGRGRPGLARQYATIWSSFRVPIATSHMHRRTECCSSMNRLMFAIRVTRSSARPISNLRYTRCGRARCRVPVVTIPTNR